MTDRNELRALQAALRGAMATSEALAAVRDRVDAADPDGEISIEDLEDLARVTLAHAVSSQALRGLIESMRSRREAGGGSRQREASSGKQIAPR
jgi:hypothetical protein